MAAAHSASSDTVAKNQVELVIGILRMMVTAARTQPKIPNLAQERPASDALYRLQIGGLAGRAHISTFQPVGRAKQYRELSRQMVRGGNLVDLRGFGPVNIFAKPHAVYGIDQASGVFACYGRAPPSALAGTQGEPHEPAR